MARRIARRKEGNDPDVMSPMIDDCFFMMMLDNLLKLSMVVVWLVKAISVRLISSLSVRSSLYCLSSMSLDLWLPGIGIWCRK